MLSFFSSPFANFNTQSVFVWSTVFLATFAVPQILQAQVEEAVSVAAGTQKVIHEPVHRVPKVASKPDAIPVKSVVLNSQLFSQPVENDFDKNEPGESEQVNDDPAEDSIAENADIIKPSIPATLPSATKTIVDSGNVAPPAVQPTVPVQPASAKTVVPHPLDNALSIARRGLENIRETVQDYSAILIKRERVNGELLKPEYMQVKIRSERVTESGEEIPFSVYIKFIKPRALAGREVIWVKGRNDGKLCVHEGSGIISLKRMNLVPTSWLAMRGQRYPVYEAGMENLVVKLIEKAERDKAAGDCEAIYREGVKVNKRECSVIEVRHKEEKAPYDFHIAKVYIDEELRLPIRYQAHIWPEPGSTKPRLLEEYTYLNVKINQGLTDMDFNPDNPLYNYPKR